MSVAASISSIATSLPPSSSDAAAVEPKKPLKLPWLVVGLTAEPATMWVSIEMVDAIAEAEGMALSSVSFKALVGRGFIGDAPVIFSKPQTYMNKSGWSHCLILQNSIAASTCEFDLENRKSVLDEQGLRIAENQENSQKNRRKLAESTRDFKKASPEEKLNIFNSLLKGYQEEVDNLTKRAKFGENAVLNIYQKLCEAPDPYLALADAEQDLKLSELESENRKMKVELEEFGTEATHLKNQQATIRRLEEHNRQFEQQMEDKAKEIVEIKQRSFAEENQKVLEVLSERVQMLQDQLRLAKDSVFNMQKLHELAQSQLFEVRAQLGREGNEAI